MTIQVQSEEFTSVGKNVIVPGWTEMMPWKQIDIKDVPNLKKGDTVKIISVNLNYFYNSFNNI